ASLTSIFSASALPSAPSSPTPKVSAGRFIWNGFTSLLFQAFQRAISFADNFLSSWALVIFGFGFGEGDGEAVASWAKLMVAKASTHSAAKGRYLFIGVLLGFFERIIGSKRAAVLLLGR